LTPLLHTLDSQTRQVETQQLIAWDISPTVYLMNSRNSHSMNHQ
jgi:hypothetical protein